MNKFGFILIKPQFGENIGACARSMKNFGFKKLKIVSPKFFFPSFRFFFGGGTSSGPAFRRAVVSALQGRGGLVAYDLLKGRPDNRDQRASQSTATIKFGT